MLSFAYRSSHGIRKHPIRPLCRVYLNLNTLGRARPAAVFTRGFAQTRPATAAKTETTTKAAAKTKTKVTTSKRASKTKASEIPEPSPPIKRRSKTKASEIPEPSVPSKKKSKTATEQDDSKAPAPQKKPKGKVAKAPSLRTPEDLSALWDKSMEIVGKLNKIGPEKLTGSQVTLMAGTLDVIKTVLTSQARKIAQTHAKGQSSADVDTKEKEAAVQSLDMNYSNGITGGDTSGPVFPRRVRSRLGSLSPLPTSLQESKPSDTETIPVPLSQRPRPGDADTTIPAWHQKHLASVQKLSAGGLLKPIDVPTPPVPLIQYGLDRVLFNEGVYALQDPRTGVFNFDPYLAKIMPVTEFDFDALKEYITSSRDEILLAVTKKLKKKYTGSTSSMTATLAHFHFLLSNWRQINLARISREYEPEQHNFVAVLRAPAATFLNYNDGVYAIDADKQFDDDTILSMLGKSMEMLLTAPRDEYEKYRRDVSHKLTEEERNKPESYHYTEFEDFVMRSQLDAYDPRLPGTGIYDLKTRAVVSIRMDAINYKKGRPYEIMKRTGEWESFEREYHDMIRGAFLKYSLQVRMGRMDGIFVAYHNTQRIFGFQYIPLEEMDHSIHGTTDTTLGDKEFQTSLKLWNIMLNEATKKFPKQSLRVHVETRPSQNTPFLYFFAEPVTPDEVKKVQVKDQKKVERFREKVLGIAPQEPNADEADEDDVEAEDEDLLESTSEETTSEKQTASEESSNKHTKSEEVTQDAEEEASEEVWEDIMSVVEETMENDVRGITAIRDAIEEALQQSGLLKAKSSEDAQHYIDALLKAIVDVEADKESATPKEQSNGGSPLGFFSRIISSFGQAKTPKPEDPTAETTSKGKLDATDNSPATQNSELVDLIIKMTSRAGVPTNVAKEIEEVSDDQAKLRNFETLLSELVATDESAEAESEATTASSKEDGFDAGQPKEGTVTAEKPVFGMILTSRNKVNNDYVDRPENLNPEDDWKIEYRMEEIPSDKVQQLYSALKSRRKKAFLKTDPKGMRFDSIFEGNLRRYSDKGAEYRKKMDRLDKARRPMFAVGHPGPFYGPGMKLEAAPRAEPPYLHVKEIVTAKQKWNARRKSLGLGKSEAKLSKKAAGKAKVGKTKAKSEKPQPKKPKAKSSSEAGDSAKAAASETVG